MLGDWTTIALLCAVSTLVAAVLPLAIRVRNGTFDLLEPIVGGTIMLAAIFGIRPIAMLVQGDFIYRGVDIAGEFPAAVALGLLGTIAFVTAYEWTGRREPRALQTPRPRERRIKRRIAYGYVGVLGVLAILLFGVHLSRLGADLVDGLRLLVAGQSPELVRRWAATTEYLSTAPILGACAATILGIATQWRPTRSQLALIVALIAYPLIVFYLSGARRYMLPCLLVPLAAWMLTSGWRPSRRVLLAVVPLAFVVLATIPFVRWVGTRDDRVGGASALIEALGNPGQAVYRFILGPDTNMVPALAIEVGVLRSPAHFSYGRATIGDLLLAPIPHLIFPAKPQTARDELLTRAFGAPCRLSGDGVCDDFSIIGTFYQDFWLPGVVFLMGVVGAGSAFLWSRWRRSRDDPRLVLAASTWAVFLPIIVRAGFMPGFQWWLYFLVPCLLGVAISLRTAAPNEPVQVSS